MTCAGTIQAPGTERYTSTSEKFRRAATGNEPTIFTDIYEEDTNIVIWQRELPVTLRDSVDGFLVSNPTFQTSMTVTPQSALASIRESLDSASSTTKYIELSEDIAELVDMFCCLFELKRTGLRLTALDRAMCPRFHVDKVPCRLVSTYQGVATEWLPHQLVNRTKLGAKSNGQPDHQSGLFQNPHDIQRLSHGDVALLKGELWEGNENAGLVHRSPALPNAKNRLLLTLDFSS